jgi:hypothetical protein
VHLALSLDLAPTVADWTAMQLPSALSFLYRLIRPFRLAAKYAPHTAKRHPSAPAPSVKAGAIEALTQLLAPSESSKQGGA